MSTITPAQEQAITGVLGRVPHLSTGRGDREAMCSVAAINLALTNTLTDEIPPCMSEVVGRWIIRVQDAMPASIRDSVEWRRLLPLAAGTGRDDEVARLKIVMDWMWGTVLPFVQPVADAGGWGDAWRAMCGRRTSAAAYAAASAAADAADAASAAASAASAASAAAYAASAAASAANAYAAADAAADAFWEKVDPVGLLARLVMAPPIGPDLRMDNAETVELVDA